MKISGYKDHRSITLMRRGCCPPMLSELMNQPYNPNVAKNDPVQAAIAMHKKGYLGWLRDD